MRRRTALRTAVLAAGLATTLAISVTSGLSAQAQDSAVSVRLLAFNDLHGSLEPPPGVRSQVKHADGSLVPAGGAAYLAAYVAQLRGQATRSLLYSVGDNWGSSALESAMFHDEPTVQLLNEMGVDASAIGNHELDEGYTEFRRMQTGGCHPVDGCRFGNTFAGANFPLLAANMEFDDGAPATLPFTVDYVEGIPVGVIATMPADTATMVTPEGVGGLRFTDELAAVDRTADLLDFFGVRAIVLLLHKGAEPVADNGPNSCEVTSGPARDLALRASPKVDVIFTADSHQQYNCSFPDPMGNPRVMMQGASHGRIVSVVDVSIDRTTRDVLRDRASAFNQVVTHDIPPDPDVQALADSATAQASRIGAARVASLSGDLTRDEAASGESTLGNVVADAQLAAGSGYGAQVALTNPGGLREDLLRGVDGAVTYGQTYAAQPFGNTLEVLTVTGAVLKAALEQQFQPRGDGTVTERILAPSRSLTYALNRSAIVGERISDLRVNGEPVDPARPYRVAVNKFLADGGDGFDAFRTRIEAVHAGCDLDALTTYLGANSPVTAPNIDRITVVG
ncbi:bifunctional metallophosphatase/5'-nucleotidase [Rhodococcus pseudokoreensis]|uniref:Bifunctional metallophosphatase/5'-nucleotidase n=1 Tax=Rhodococcus pseudokoreensis TaxID=2811421 RepID=A0A974W4N1_9NOCA|nr:bifunctional UDP-sugar hydrolase/5'-nucleotidase [Rhodococcus pseudokoreensis]QSE91185.1 bifunctional metallophosphatase/5'-nucleotidase [Rhodococcus pseudokoreensis]